jgi:hypothetical protein
MRIKWLILVILIAMILAGTVSAAVMVRSVRQSSDVKKELKVEQAQGLVNVPTNYPTIGLGYKFITTSGPQEVQIPVSVYDVKDLTNMDLEVDLVPADMSGHQGFPLEIPLAALSNTPSDFGNLRVINVDKGNLIEKALFDSQTKSMNDHIFDCYTGAGMQCDNEPGPWHHETVKLSLASSEFIRGQWNIAEITCSINVPSSELQNYGILAIVSLKNARDSAGNRIKFTPYGGFMAAETENLFAGFVVMAGTVTKGDGDGDGVVTGKDAVAALAIAVGKQPYNPIYDMNDDGKVDSTDVIEILKLSIQSSGAQQGVSPEHGG